MDVDLLLGTEQALMLHSISILVFQNMGVASIEAEEAAASSLF